MAYVDEIKKRFAGEWEALMREGSKRNSPDTTAFIMAILAFKDMILRYATSADRQWMRQIITDGNYEPDPDVEIFFRLRFSFMLASRLSGKTIPRDVFLAAIRDIHNLIFDDNEENLEQSIHYFIKAGDKIAGTARELTADSQR